MRALTWFSFGVAVGVALADMDVFWGYRRQLRQIATL